MPITSVIPDAETLTLTVVGDYAVPVERLWAAWTDPRQLERFWGPPTWPATFTAFDLRVGGKAEYHMTGPEGQKSGGYWRFTEVHPGRGFTFVDGFCQPDGTPNDDLPGTIMEMEFESTPGGSRYVAVSRFPSIEAMEQLVAMGMIEGLKAAQAQLDGVLGLEAA
ncbi:MAG: SRPBCC domain-containing protein [Myxococcales bacterium]|nr:SRPBCC domain-containing protein [Myxococcales bacterium]